MTLRDPSDPSDRNSPPFVLLASLVFVVASVLLSCTPGLRAEHRLLVDLQKNRPVSTVELDPGGEFRLYLNPNDKTITPFILYLGQWEPKETEWFSRIIKKGDTVVDVGANIGYYTILASRLVGDEGRVFAFEPDPVNFSFLKKNVRVNGLRNVTLEQKAVAAESGSLRLYLAAENKGDHRIYSPSDEEREFVEVEAVTLDDYFAGDPRPLDFIKVDTQGAEVVILQGMQRMLRGSEFSMAVEFWPWGLADFGFTAGQQLELLRPASFRMFDLAGSQGSSLLETNERVLLKKYTKKGRKHTNLLLVRGTGVVDAMQAEGEVTLLPPAGP